MLGHNNWNRMVRTGSIMDLDPSQSQGQQPAHDPGAELPISPLKTGRKQVLLSSIDYLVRFH